MMGRMWIAGLAVAGMVLVSGCGGATTPTPASTPGGEQAPAATTDNQKTPSAEELLNTMKESMNTATSLRIKVRGTMEGQPATVELAGQRDGSNQTATIDLGENKGNAEVVTVDGKDYIKGDRAFWSAQGAGEQAGQLEGKYVNSNDTTMSKQFNVGMFLEEAQKFEVSLGDKVNTRVERDTVDGVETYKLSSRVGEQDSVLWVTADGKAQLVKANGMEQGQPMEMHLSEWNEVSPVSAPPADQVVTP